MNKCISCGFEIPPQTRFCGNCGAVQPTGTNQDEAGSLETISSTPRAENTPSSAPPPPSASAPNRPNINNTPVQLNNQPSGPQLTPSPQPQPQTSYGDYQQPSSPYGNYQQPYSDYQQPQQSQSSYNNYQQTPSPYGDYQQPQSPYGNFQQTPSAPAPYGNFQQTPQLPQPPQSYNNYQQPQSAEVHTTGTVPNANTGAPPTTPVITEKKAGAPGWLKWAIIGVVVLLILGVSGFLLLRPPALVPTISVTSSYHDNGTPAAADGTSIHVKGQKFANNSAVAFLLDNTPLTTSTQSDAAGNISMDLPVTASWTAGQHTLTAHDASNNTTNTGAPIKIVQPGEASTPGPNGAPANSATFNVKLNAQMQQDSDHTHFASSFTLNVTGQPDPKGGTVCSPGDDGTPQTTQIPDVSGNGVTYNEVSTYGCSGTYTNGKITYNETLQTRRISNTAGDNCVLNNPQTAYTQVTGTYTAQKEFSGTVTFSSIDPAQFTCQNLTYTPGSATGTWTGSVNNA